MVTPTKKFTHSPDFILLISPNFTLFTFAPHPKRRSLTTNYANVHNIAREAAQRLSVYVFVRRHGHSAVIPRALLHPILMDHQINERVCVHINLIHISDKQSKQLMRSTNIKKAIIVQSPLIICGECMYQPRLGQLVWLGGTHSPTYIYICILPTQIKPQKQQRDMPL